jgi:hypothetical protein
MTSSGPDTRNIGAATKGTDSRGRIVSANRAALALPLGSSIPWRSPEDSGIFFHPSHFSGE